MAKLEQVAREEEYEVRLIIWETRDVPLIDGSKVDIYVRAIYQTDGWDAENIEKATDIHYNSNDGRGVFNYRMNYRV